MITELGETKLMTRMVGGDLIASEAKYHLQCLVKLRNQYRSLNRKLNQNSENTDEKMNESRAFVEPTNYIKKAVESGINLFTSHLHWHECSYTNKEQEAHPSVIPNGPQHIL